MGITLESKSITETPHLKIIKSLDQEIKDLNIPDVEKAARLYNLNKVKYTKGKLCSMFSIKLHDLNFELRKIRRENTSIYDVKYFNPILHDSGII